MSNFSARSESRACGTTSLSTKSRAVSAISRCSSVSSIMRWRPSPGPRRSPSRSASCAAAVTGPASKATPSTAATVWISRTVEARKTSLAPSRSRDRELALGDRQGRDHDAAGDRVEDPGAQRGRAELAVGDPEDRRGRRLEHHVVGADEQGLVDAAALGDPRRVHVRPVGERLDAVQDQRGAVGDAREPDRGQVLDQWLDQRDPPAAAGDDEPQLGVALPVRLEQRLDLGLELGPLRGQLDRGGGALDPLQVLGEGERAALVQADHLEHAVAAVEAVVLERDRCLGGRRDPAVDGCELGHGHRVEAIQPGPSHGSRALI